MKTPFPNRCSGIFLVESIEGWSKKQDKTSKQTSDDQTNQSGRSKRSLHESQGKLRGERDVIRLRNRAEDERGFRRMLTSAWQPRHNTTRYTECISPVHLWLFTMKYMLSSFFAFSSLSFLVRIRGKKWIRIQERSCFYARMRFFSFSLLLAGITWTNGEYLSVYEEVLMPCIIILQAKNPSVLQLKR